MPENNNSAKKVTECTIKDVQSLFSPEPSKSKASRMIAQCRDAYALKEHQILTLEKFKTYYALN